MYNISKLSDMSRTFIGSVKAGPCANIAAAKAIANHLAIPSGPVEDAEEHYRQVHYGTARKLVSDINEVVTINVRDTLELVQSFWKARYGVAYPDRMQPLNMPETCYAFFGYGKYISGDVLCEIEKGGNVIVRMLNGFTAVIADLTYVAETPVEQTSMVGLESEQLTLAQEGVAGWLLGFFINLAPIPFISTAIGATTKALVESKRREIVTISEEIVKLRVTGSKAAYDAGKITEGKYKKESEVEVFDVIEGAVFGTIPIIAAFYTAHQTSQLQNESKKLSVKIKEFNQLLKDEHVQKDDVKIDEAAVEKAIKGE